MWSFVAPFLPTISSRLAPFIPSLVSLVSPYNLTGFWEELSKEEKELVYTVADTVQILTELGPWRYPLGAGLIVLFVVLLVAYSQKLLMKVEEDMVCACLEYMAMAAGLILGGPAFVIGALMMKKMRRMEYRATLILLVLLLFCEVCPTLLLLVPRRSPLPDPSVWDWVPKFN